jgi:hypothetical protein
MSAKAILNQAYKSDLVPYRLHGKTQHKTLQARLSIDILRNRERSRFFRNQPGKFFLREFIKDKSIPEEFRQEVHARRRTRDLVRGSALAFSKEKMRSVLKGRNIVDAEEVLPLLRIENFCQYQDVKDNDEAHLKVRAFACIRRNNEVLSYRCGSYRDDRDNFAQKRSLGFSAVVLEKDRTLFDFYEYGISESGLSAVSADLNVPILESSEFSEQFSHSLKAFILTSDDTQSTVIALLEIHAPDWFEPIRGSLSINDLSWMRCDLRPNNIDDFDPWSRAIIEGSIFTKDKNVLHQKSC